MTEHADGIVIGGCRLGAVIGRGGMGTVYAAAQSGINRPVAIKLMPVASGDDAAIARFQREAQTAGALDHPHCLPLYAAGESDGLLYLVMRLVDGPNLAQLIHDHGWLPPARAATIIEQISGAVDSAHRAGLVHRDLKPANILIEPRDDGQHAFLEPEDGYTRWSLQSPDGTVDVDIDRTANATTTLQAHMATVQQGIKSSTTGYRFRAHYATSFPSGTALVWVFSINGLADGQRVDVFRQIGSSQYAVLGSSSSLQASRAAATEIAYSIREP